MLAALDASLTSTGWARCPLDGSSLEVGTIKPRGRGVARLQDALNQVVRVVDGAVLVLLEGYAHGKGYQAHQLGELGGVLRLGLYQRGTPFVEVPPACVKKLASGNGNAKKERVLAEAIRRLGYRGASNDEADARWLLELARVHFEVPGAASLPKKHLEFMEKIDWPELALEVAQ